MSGGSPQQNNYLLNGISINDYTNQAPGSILGGNLGVDAVSEFSVLTSNQGSGVRADRGWGISAITRSGTNHFHGSAYEFLRNSVLDARNFFDRPDHPAFPPKSVWHISRRAHQKGQDLHLRRLRAVRQSLGLSMIDNVPSLAARHGLLCDHYTGLLEHN